MDFCRQYWGFFMKRPKIAFPQRKKRMFTALLPAFVRIVSKKYQLCFKRADAAGGHTCT
jgi:hypothetical protein